MGIIVDKFLIPSLENISKKYNLNQQVEGILLAIGASIPEFTTNLTASLTNNINIGVGSISGSGAYDFTMCFGIASLFSLNGVKLYGSLFFRDSIIYLGTLVILTFFIKNNIIELHETVILTFLWPIYLIIVAYCFKSNIEESGETQTQNSSDIQIVVNEDKIDDKEERSDTIAKDNIATGLFGINNDFQELQTDEFSTLISENNTTINSDNNESELIEKNSFIKRICEYVTKVYSYFIPLWQNCPILCFFYTMIIVFIHSNIIVILIESISIQLDISKTFLGMTIISLGGNIGDTINAIVLTKNDAGALLTTSTLGSQIMNLQLCLGLPWTIAIIKEKLKGNSNSYIEIGEGNKIYNNPLYYFIPLIVCVLSSMMIIFLFQMKLNKYSGIGLIIVYLTYLFYESYIQIGKTL